MSDHVGELLELYALGGLEPDERQRVEAHLAECDVCRKEADALRALVTAVAYSAPAVEPQGEARSRLLERTGGTPPRPAPFGLRGAAWLPLALSLLLALALLSWNVYLNVQLNKLRQQVAIQQQIMGLVTSPTTHPVDLEGQGELVSAFGRAYVDERSHNIVLIAWHLRPLGPDQTYQAWLIDKNGQPVSAGVFKVNEAGWGMYTLDVHPAPGEFNGIGVSLEPAGGSTKPSQVVLVGGL